MMGTIQESEERNERLRQRIKELEIELARANRQCISWINEAGNAKQRITELKEFIRLTIN